jgi:hypothetical protein
MKELELLITHYEYLRDQYGMQSQHMKSIGDQFRLTKSIFIPNPQSPIPFLPIS